MNPTKVFIFISIAIALLATLAVAKPSSRRFKNKGAKSDTQVAKNDTDISLAGSENPTVLPTSDNPGVGLNSSVVAEPNKKGKKTHRLKHRRFGHHHKRRNHRNRKNNANKQENENDSKHEPRAPNTPSDAPTAAALESPEMARDAKHISLNSPSRKVHGRGHHNKSKRHHHHHHRPQNRRSSKKVREQLVGENQEE